MAIVNNKSMLLVFRGNSKAKSVSYIFLLWQSISLVSLCAEYLCCVADICFVVLYVVWLRKCATTAYHIILLDLSKSLPRDCSNVQISTVLLELSLSLSLCLPWFSPKPPPNPTSLSTQPSLLAMSELRFPGSRWRRSRYRRRQHTRS